MKTTLLLCAIFAGTFAFSQTNAQPKVALDLGSVTVWLGMPKAEVFSRFDRAGYKVVDISPENTAEGKLLPVLAGNHVYNVAFQKGRLSFADRTWNSEGTPDLQAVISSLALIAKDNPMCTISHQPMSDPGNLSDRIFVTCGYRSVLIVSGKIQNMESNEVSERIGNVY